MILLMLNYYKLNFHFEKTILNYRESLRLQGDIMNLSVKFTPGDIL